MNAVKMLKQQHREVEKLFEKFEGAKSPDRRRKVFEEIADALAVHAAIEERHFYPGVKKRQTEDLLLESVEEHLEIKRVIADLLHTEPQDDAFDAKVKVLQEDVEHHVEEEEKELFPEGGTADRRGRARGDRRGDGRDGEGTGERRRSAPGGPWRDGRRRAALDETAGVGIDARDRLQGSERSVRRDRPRSEDRIARRRDRPDHVVGHMRKRSSHVRRTHARLRRHRRIRAASTPRPRRGSSCSRSVTSSRRASRSARGRRRSRSTTPTFAI